MTSLLRNLISRSGIVRRAVLLGAAGLLLLAAPTAALAWDSYYSWEESRNPGRIRYSGANYNLDYHILTFAPYVGSGDKMQATLCDSSYACYSYTEGGSSFGDYRSISYGRAKCTAKASNQTWIYVYYCYISN